MTSELFYPEAVKTRSILLIVKHDFSRIFRYLISQPGYVENPDLIHLAIHSGSIGIFRILYRDDIEGMETCQTGFACPESAAADSARSYDRETLILRTGNKDFLLFLKDRIQLTSRHLVTVAAYGFVQCIEILLGESLYTGNPHISSKLFLDPEDHEMLMIYAIQSGNPNLVEYFSKILRIQIEHLESGHVQLTSPHINVRFKFDI